MPGSGTSTNGAYYEHRNCTNTNLLPIYGLNVTLALDIPVVYAIGVLTLLPVMVAVWLACGTDFY